MVSGDKERANITDDGRDPGRDDAEREVGREPGLDPCRDLGIFKNQFTGAGFRDSNFVMINNVATQM